MAASPDQKGCFGQRHSLPREASEKAIQITLCQILSLLPEPPARSPAAVDTLAPQLP